MNQRTLSRPNTNWRVCLTALNDILVSRRPEDNLETVLQKLSSLALTTLGDPEAPSKPGNLKPGEHQFSVAGFFMHLPKERASILIAEEGFPTEQHRLRIPDNLGHPGWVVQNQKPLLLANTDEHSDFEQILKTARMGSAMYSPLIQEENFIGQFITASQARNTYGPDDHALQQTIASCATLIYSILTETAFPEKDGALKL